jgi:hypothetical protein
VNTKTSANKSFATQMYLKFCSHGKKWLNDVKYNYYLWIKSKVYMNIKTYDFGNKLQILFHHCGNIPYSTKGKYQHQYTIEKLQWQVFIKNEALKKLGPGKKNNLFPKEEDCHGRHV